jgi:hypothetical protein
VQIDLFATDPEATPATRMTVTPDPVTVQGALFPPAFTAMRDPHRRPAPAVLDPALHGDTLTPTGGATTMTGPTPAGTFTALHVKAVAICDYPRVTLPSGLSGRVSTAPTTDGRYLIGLFGFGVGDIDITLTVDADADVAATVDAALRSRPDFIATLRARQDGDRQHGEPASPLSEGRDRWLTTL